MGNQSSKAYGLTVLCPVRTRAPEIRAAMLDESTLCASQGERRRHQAQWARILGSIVLLVLTSCDGDDSPSSTSDVEAGKVDAGKDVSTTQNCRPDQLIDCVGPGGCQGFQTCYLDGSGYGPCLCYSPTFSAFP
jgi:hypothetical protein